MKKKRALIAVLGGALVLALAVGALAFWGNGNGGDYEPYVPAIASYEPEVEEVCEVELAEAEAQRAAERAEREAYWIAFAQEALAQQEAERAEMAEARRLAREAECCVDCGNVGDDASTDVADSPANNAPATGNNGNQGGNTSNGNGTPSDPPTQTPNPTPDPPPVETWNPCRPGCNGFSWFAGYNEFGGRDYGACSNQPRPW